MAVSRTEQADPFGLWQPAEQAGPQSFALPSEGAPVADESEGGLVWLLDLHSGTNSGAAAQLEMRERQVRAIEEGLGQAVARAERTLARHRAAAQGAEVAQSFGPGEVAEMDLSAALAEIDPGEMPASFALGLPSVDWDELKGKFDAFMAGINQQVLHYCWVETKLDGGTVARSTMQWGGDLNTTMRSGTAPDLAAAHNHSLALALQSRSANMRTAITVMQIAAKIALMVTTPIGVVQALSLAWQFVFQVIVPLLEEART